ncbi:MAG: nucleotidyltransferase family protein [Anaerolineae bacterium]|nr:nucleotidyltransferase family protein [Anaerolineae bacterium]
MQLTPEETLTYEFAHNWRDISYRPNLQNIDLPRFARILTHNRMAVLAAPIIERSKAEIPSDAQKLINEQIEKYKRSASKLGGALVTYLKAAKTREIPTIILKGLWLCEKIYKDLALRPGGDIDILVPKNQVDASLALLNEQGIGEFWPNLLKDEYFTKHHLHQQRSTPDLSIWFEIHWALDHPYTLLTVNYESIFERAKPAQLLGAPIQEMALPDLLLSLAIHLVKHAVYLPSLLDREDLPRIILADGMLMYYLDVAEVLKRHKDIDWELTIQLTRDWGAVDILGSVLQVCKKYFDAPIPDEVLSALAKRVRGPWPITRKLMARAAEQKLATYEGKPVNRFWQLMLASNGAFILRPVRLLETASYFFPPTDFLERRYDKTNPVIRIYHLFKALWQTLIFSWDTFYFGMERYFRLKRMGKKTSLFNTLETDL